MKFVKMAVAYVAIGIATAVGARIGQEAYHTVRDPYERAKAKQKFKNFMKRFSKKTEG